MHIVTTAARLPRHLPRPVVAIGTFDGVHRAHHALLRYVVRAARRWRGTSVVISFDPHPQHVLRRQPLPSLLTRLEQRLVYFRALGIQLVWVVRFTRRFAALSPEQFVERILVRSLQAQAIVVGPTFGFGRGRRGNVALLRRLARRAGMRVHVVPPVRLGRTIVNSSRIRAAIQAGELATARQLLGRGVILRAPVIRGAARGTQLGYPTANVDYEHLALPPDGVYTAWVTVGARRYPAVANIGRRPTFHEHRRTVEVHLLGFRGRLYGRWVDIEWREKLRDEQTFPTVQHLRRQIAADLVIARRRFRHQPSADSVRPPRSGRGR